MVKHLLMALLCAGSVLAQSLDANFDVVWAKQHTVSFRDAGIYDTVNPIHLDAFKLQFDKTKVGFPAASQALQFIAIPDECPNPPCEELFAYVIVYEVTVDPPKGKKYKTYGEVNLTFGIKGDEVRLLHGYANVPDVVMVAFYLK